VVALVFLFNRMPTAYLPNEDQGIMFVQAMLPAGATLEQTEQVLDKVRSHFLEDEKQAVNSCLTLGGRGFSGTGQNVGLAFVQLKDWDLRHRADLKIDALVGRAMGKFSQIRNAMVFAFPPPAVLELGQAGGFDFQLQDRGGLGHEALMMARNQMLGMAARDPRLIRVRPNGLEDVAQYRIDVDWEKAGALGVPINAVHNTIFGFRSHTDSQNWTERGEPESTPPLPLAESLKQTAGNFSTTKKGRPLGLPSPPITTHNAFKRAVLPTGRAAPSCDVVPGP
jgi:multidrug efflux pump subunit AcrB